MNTQMKKALLNDILTGLMLAAAVVAVVPGDVLAQNLAALGTNAQTQVAAPFVKFASYAAYGIGSIFLVSGIMGAKKHADNPGQNPLAPSLGKLGAAGALIVAPSVAGFLTGTATASGVTGAATFNTIPGM